MSYPIRYHDRIMKTRKKEVGMEGAILNDVSALANKPLKATRFQIGSYDATRKGPEDIEFRPVIVRGKKAIRLKAKIMLFLD